MAELVPERRTNKNGVTATKWVKPAGKPAARRFAPPPTLQDIATRNKIIEKLANAMHDTVYGREEFEEHAFRDIENNLSKYPDDTLRHIKAFYDDHSSGFRYNGGEHHVLASMIESGANSETATDLLKYAKNYANDAIVVYSHYRQRGWIDWDLEANEDPRLEALESVARNIKKAERSGKPIMARKKGEAKQLWDIPVIKDERVFKLVLENLDNTDRIVDIIKEGKTDYDLIIAELDDPVQAVSKGRL